MNWRPEGWKRYSYDEHENNVFEAGANAILKALRESGARASIKYEDLMMIALDQTIVNAGGNTEGVVVFIPDDGVKE